MSSAHRRRTQAQVSGKGYGPNAVRIALYVMSNLSDAFERRIQRGEELAVALGAPIADSVEYISPHGKRPAQVTYYEVGPPSDFSYTFMLNVLAKATVYSNRLDMEDRDIAGTAAYICESTTAVSYRHPCYCPEKSPILASDGFRRLCVATSTVLPTRSLKDKTATSSSRPVSTKFAVQSGSSTSRNERDPPPTQPSSTDAQASSSTAHGTSSVGENAPGSDLLPMASSKFSSQHSERQTEVTLPVPTPAAPISAPDAPPVTAQQAPATDPLLPMAAAELVISDPALSSPLVVSMVQGFQRLAAFTETTLTEHNIALPEPRNSWVMVQLLSQQIHAARQELEAERQRHAETRSQLQRAYAALAIAKTAISAYVSSAVGSMLESAMV